MSLKTEIAELKVRLEKLEKLRATAAEPDTNAEPWYNWDAAPDWATHAAVDSTGEANGYGSPKAIAEADFTGGWSFNWDQIPNKNFRANGCPWDKSLRLRPGKEATSEA
jgi:hypothetical protein